MTDQPSTSTQSVGAIAVSAEPIPQTTSPIPNARRLPRMSPTWAPVMRKAAITCVYSVIVAWMAMMSVSKSSTSWLIDTFLTDVSRTTRNWAVPSGISAFHRPIPVTGPPQQGSLRDCRRRRARPSPHGGERLGGVARGRRRRHELLRPARLGGPRYRAAQRRRVRRGRRHLPRMDAADAGYPGGELDGVVTGVPRYSSPSATQDFAASSAVTGKPRS